MCVVMCAQMLENSLWNSIISFHHVEPSVGIQAINLDDKCLCLFSHLASPELLFG